MDSLLFLAHRLPFPPNKGDKVRSYHLLRHLAQRYRVFLGAFIDDPLDWQHLEALKAFCAEVHVESIVPWSKRIGSVRALLTGEALTLPYFRSRELSRWVKEVVRREHIELGFAFSSPMAQYVLDLPDVRAIVDFVDVDSAKWSEYARHRPWPLSALYRREGARLLAYECDVAARADASIFVTDDEARLLQTALGEVQARVVTIRNGVDSRYFAPSRELASPFAARDRPVVFTGTMDYWPNVDAAIWFAREVLPRILSRDPAVRFYVVGMNPCAAVRALAKEPGTVVTGRVDDVRPYLQHARVVVAPLRVARGLQNKVLEAMAMAKPVVATAAAAAGLSVGEDIEIAVASDAQPFATKVLELLDPVCAETMGCLARARVLTDFAWPASLALLDALLATRSGTAGLPASAVKAGTPFAMAAR